MPKIDFETILNGIKNDLKISIDDIFEVITALKKDIESLKANNPNK